MSLQGLKAGIVAGVLMLGSAHAVAEDGNPQAAVPFGSVPKAGAARVSMVTTAAPGGEDAATVLAGAVGLFGSWGLRASLPVRFGGGGGAGSPTLALTGSAFWPMGASAALKLLTAVGVRAESLGANPVSSWYKAEPSFTRLAHRARLRALIEKASANR